MKMLTGYESFIECVEDGGFLFLTDIHPDAPSVSAMTRDEQWHTGDAETDPWQWKDRAAEEKRLAYGCILGGNKGFIAPRLYAAFVRACQPEQELEERWFSGTLKPAIWQVWQQFEEQPLQASPDLNRFWKNNGNKGTSGLDTAMKELMATFFVTVAGNRQKVGRDGVPYGWRHLLYERVDAWAPSAWLEPVESMTVDIARQAVLQAAQTLAPKVSEVDWNRLLRLKR